MDKKEAQSYLRDFNPVEYPVLWFYDHFSANSWSKPHSHPWGELAYVAVGCIVICSANGNWLAHPQTAVWIPPGHVHSWYVPCNVRDCSLWIEPGVLMGIERYSRCHMMELSPLVREILLYLCPQRCAYDSDARIRLVATLLDQLLEQREVTEPLAMPRDKRLVELCTSLLLDPGEDVSLAQWAARLGMSERNLARIFRRETGSSFRNWRMAQRMKCAQTKLRQGENVTSVALDCGYSSLSAFISSFKKIFGQTPGKMDYRRF